MSPCRNCTGAKRSCFLRAAAYMTRGHSMLGMGGGAYRIRTGPSRLEVCCATADTNAPCWALRFPGGCISRPAAFHRERRKIMIGYAYPGERDRIRTCYLRPCLPVCFPKHLPPVSPPLWAASYPNHLGFLCFSGSRMYTSRLSMRRSRILRITS